MKDCYVYIVANEHRGTLYVGITSALVQRASQHRMGPYGGFTQKYKVYRLVYYEDFGDVHAAIARETHLKKWLRQWKINLIESVNPQWEDLFPKLAG